MSQTPLKKVDILSADCDCIKKDIIVPPARASLDVVVCGSSLFSLFQNLKFI
jgi:hypothetical protein